MMKAKKQLENSRRDLLKINRRASLLAINRKKKVTASVPEFNQPV